MLFIIPSLQKNVSNIKQSYYTHLKRYIIYNRLHNTELTRPPQQRTSAATPGGREISTYQQVQISTIEQVKYINFLRYKQKYINLYRYKQKYIYLYKVQVEIYQLLQVQAEISCQKVLERNIIYSKGFREKIQQLMDRIMYENQLMNSKNK